MSFRGIIALLSAATSILLSALSCSRKEAAVSLSDYRANVVITDGELCGSKVTYPCVSITVSGPGHHTWKVRLSSDAFATEEFTLSTGETVRRDVSAPVVPGTSTSVSFSVEILHEASSEMLLCRSYTANVIYRPKESPIQFECITLMDKTGNTDTLDLNTGSPLKLMLTTGVTYSMEVNFFPVHGNESFFFALNDEAREHGVTVSNTCLTGKGSFFFNCICVSNSDVAGLFSLTLSRGTVSCTLELPFRFEPPPTPPAPPGPEPPSGDTSVSVGLPPVSFSGKPLPISVTVSGMHEGEKGTVSLYMDDALYGKAAYPGDGQAVPFSVGEDGTLRRGTHRLRAEFSPQNGSASYGSPEVSVVTYDITTRWTTLDGHHCYDGLESTAGSSTFVLHLETGCPNDLFDEVSLKEKVSGKTSYPKASDRKSIIFTRMSRGHHVLLLTARCGSVEYTWDVEADCYDAWILDLSVSGNDLKGTLVGPASTLPSQVWMEMSFTIGAYIPYMEAVGTSAEHINKPRGQYIDIERYKQQYTFEMGMVNGVKTLQSGYVGKVVSHIRSKASGIKAIENGASRWAERPDGTWYKVVYTPEVYPSLTISLYGTIRGGANEKYVRFLIGTDTLRRYIEDQGFHFRMLAPYWE